MKQGLFFVNKNSWGLLYRHNVVNLKNVDNYGYWRLCLTEVESVTGLSGEDILDGRTEECADARYILVYFLALRLTDNEIAKVSGMSRQRVNYLKLHFNLNFSKWSIKNKVQTIRKELENKLQTDIC